MMKFQKFSPYRLNLREFLLGAVPIGRWIFLRHIVVENGTYDIVMNVALHFNGGDEVPEQAPRAPPMQSKLIFLDSLRFIAVISYPFC